MPNKRQLKSIDVDKDKLAISPKNQKDKKEPVKPKTFMEQILLINPTKDCSEKETFFRNGFKSPLTNLVKFLK